MTVQATDPRSGWFRFLHHDTPLEWSDNVDERLEYIRMHKPSHEVVSRLAAIVKILDEAVPRTLHEARRAYDEARRAYDEARRAYGEAGWAYGEARRAYDEGRRAYGEAGWAYGKARRAYDEAERAYDEAGWAFGEARRAYNTFTFVIQFGPLPDGVTWNGKELVFAA